MENKAIIIHGKPSREGYENPDTASSSNAIWLPWLQKKLTLMDISTQTPEMIRAYQPDYDIWTKTLSNFIVDDSTILVGHSCGAGFIVQWLSSNPDIKVSHVFLVAPSFGDTLVSNPEDKYEEPLLNGFFDFSPDPDLISRTESLHLIYSNNDSVRVNSTVELLQKTYPYINQHMFEGYGHFRGKQDMSDDTFPELLEIITNELQHTK